MGFTWIEKGIEPIDEFLIDLGHGCDAEVNVNNIQKLTAALRGSRPYIGRMAKLHLAFWGDGRKRIHAVKSAIHAIGVRLFPVFYDIKSESRRRWIL